MTWRLVVGLATILLILPAASATPPVPPAVDVVVSDTSTTADSVDLQAPVPASRLSLSRFSVWAAGSVSPGGVLGSLQNGWFGLVGLRYHRLLIPHQRRHLATHDAATLTYTADLVPLARVTIPKGTPPMARSLRTRSVTDRGLQTRGLGVYPIGLRVGFRPTRILRPFISGHTGLLYLFDALPDERGRRLNFAAGVGVGLEIAITRRTTVTLGYRYHHLSNGFRGRINPGFDANLLYVGIGRTP